MEYMTTTALITEKHENDIATTSIIDLLKSLAITGMPIRIDIHPPSKVATKIVEGRIPVSYFPSFLSLLMLWC